MKKILVYPLTLVIVTFFSCNKDTSTSGPTNNGWVVGAQSFTGLTCSRVTQTNTLVAIDSSHKSSLIIYFGKLPITSGFFKVKSLASGGGSQSFDEIGISGSVISSSSDIFNYISTGADSPTVQASVTVTNGKITIVLPSFLISGNRTTGSIQTNVSTSAGGVFNEN